jgi:RNA polymerase sigma factor (sigma-70 family)
VRDVAEDDLDRCMARLADGDREAFDPLFRALHPRALRLARAKLGVMGDLASDVAQASLVKMFARASEFEPGRPVVPWFYAVLANEIRAARRKSRTNADSVGGDAALETLAGPEDPEAALAAMELEAALDEAVGSLDAPSAEAIAQLLGRRDRPAIAPEAFRKRVSRAYARLRVMLGGFR